MKRQELSEFLDSSAGKALGISIVIAGLAIALWSIRASFQNPLGDVNTGNYICAETGKVFSYTIKKGDRIPVYSSYSGKNTGYPAELCFWTKDGGIKKTPTLVLLRQYKGETGPTFCPDCGRLVRAQSSPPVPGMKAPPTEAEYKLTGTNNSTN